MPTSPVAQVTSLECEVEAADILVALILALSSLTNLIRERESLLVGITTDSVKHLTLLATLLLAQHRTRNQDNLGIWILGTNHRQEHTIVFLIMSDVIIIGREVIGAQVDTHQLRLILIEVPLLIVLDRKSVV